MVEIPQKQTNKQTNKKQSNLLLSMDNYNVTHYGRYIG